MGTMLLIVGIVIMLIICIVVKVFDDVIREKQWRKALVNSITFVALITFIAGIIILLKE